MSTNDETKDINNQNGEDGQQADTHTAQNGEGTEKTFSQDEVNQIVQERIAREKKGMPTKEELDEFNKWKDSQKTIEEKSLEKDKTIEQLHSKIESLERMGKLSAKNVDSKYQKFVLSEVSSMEGDFETNLDKYLQDNSQYLVNSAPDHTAKDTGMSMNGVGSDDGDDGATAILRAKHPELFK